MAKIYGCKTKTLYPYEYFDLGKCREFIGNVVEILDYCMNEYVKLSIKEYKLNPLHYVSLPGYSFDCWLMSNGVTLD